MPASVATPRSRNSTSEPATRSLTVLETSTSPGSASAAMPAPMCTAIPPSLSVYELALPGVEPDPHCDPERVSGVADRAGAADRAGGPIEAGEEAVSCGIELTAAVPNELPSDQGVIALDQFAPSGIAEIHCLLCRVDDLQEEHRRDG